MAKRTTLNELPDRSGPNAKYPWHKWLDGAVWELTLDDVSGESQFRSIASAAGKRLGKRVSIRKLGDVFYLQATDRND